MAQLATSLLLCIMCCLAACQDNDEVPNLPGLSTEVYYLSSCSVDTIFEGEERWSNGTGEIFKRVEQMPSWPTCKDIASSELRDSCTSAAILSHIDDRLDLPQEAKAHCDGKEVLIEFIVDKQGCLQSISVPIDTEYGCGSPVQGVIAQMPQWDPGRQRGREVEVLYYVRYIF